MLLAFNFNGTGKFNRCDFKVPTSLASFIYAGDRANESVAQRITLIRNPGMILFLNYFFLYKHFFILVHTILEISICFRKTILEIDRVFF